jgi:DnaJ-class molecular chaperone
MSVDTSYYDILGVDKLAPVAEIKNSYRKRMRECHPDKLPPEKKEWGEKMCKDLNEAWEILKDPEKRELYDKYGKDNGQGMPNGMHNMNDIINEMFKKAHGQTRAQQTIPPIKIVQNVTLEDVYNGKTVTINIERCSLCKACNATGFTDKQKHDCKKCKGSGFIKHIQQLGPGFIQQFQQPCSQCMGSGLDTTSSLKCLSCGGMTFINENIQTNIEIPKGVKNRDILQIINQGNEIPIEDRTNNGITRGPVLIIINELDHDIFKRGIVINQKMNPANICILVDVSLADAIAGFKKTITHLDGRKLYFTETKIIKNGDIGVILGEGLPIKDKKYAKGDLFIKYNVKVPDNLTNDQRASIYKILTGNDYVDDDPGDDHIYVNKINIDNYGSNNSTYDSDDEYGHQTGPGECRTQ